MSRERYWLSDEEAFVVCLSDHMANDGGRRGLNARDVCLAQGYNPGTIPNAHQEGCVRALVREYNRGWALRQRPTTRNQYRARASQNQALIRQNVPELWEASIAAIANEAIRVDAAAGALAALERTCGRVHDFGSQQVRPGPQSAQRPSDVEILGAAVFPR